MNSLARSMFPSAVGSLPLQRRDHVVRRRNRRELTAQLRQRRSVNEVRVEVFAVECPVERRGRVARNDNVESPVLGHPCRRRDTVVGRQATMTSVSEACRGASP